MSLFLGVTLIIACLYLFKGGFALLFVVGILLFTFWKKPASYQKIILLSLFFVAIFFLRIYLLSRGTGLPKLGLVFARGNHYYLLLTFKGRFYVSAASHRYEVGDILAFNGSDAVHKFYTYEQQFDFGGYLQNRGVYRSLHLTNIEYVWCNPLRITQIKTQLLNAYSGSTRELLNALVFHQREADSRLFQKFASLELAYLFGASGLHLNALIRLMRKLLRRYIKQEAVILFLGTILPLTLLSLLLPNHFAIYRIGGIAILQLLNQRYFKGNLSYLSRLSIAAFIFLFINPFYAFQPAFYLSFGLLFALSLTRSLTKGKKKIIKLLLGGVFAYLFMLPYVLSKSYQLHFLTPVLTLILGPLLSATYLLGLLTFIFPFLIPVLNWLTKALFLLLDLLIKFDLKVIFGKPSKVWIILFYLLLFLTLYAVFVRHRPLKTMGLIGLILLVVPFQKKITHLGTEAIYFINVGQGDAILVRHERKTILIDTGGTRYRDLALETLIPFFYSLQITALDAVWITHDDYDHSGALASLAQHFPIGSILSDERVYDFGDLQMQNLNYQFRDQFHDENDRSAVLYFPLMGKNFLLMGDASSQVEEHLLVNYPALAVDVLKLGHHGSATSSSYAFLQSFTPELAIISVGKNNYGHPSEQVLNRLDELQIPYLRTDEVGTITLTGIGNVCYNKTSQKWL